MFDSRRLRLLHELALRGTLAAVAEALSTSPSTVSEQLARLEREAGVALLEPDGRRVRLTRHGVVLAAHAARVLDLDEQVRGELRAGGPGGRVVRVAVLQTAAQALWPRALTVLAAPAAPGPDAAVGPAVRVELVELPPEDGLFGLRARRFDVVIAEQYPGHTREHLPGIERTVLGADPVRLALPPGVDGPGVAGVAGIAGIADLADHAWVMEPTGTAARDWAVQQCRAAGFEPRVPFEVADLVAHARLVRAGHAAGMLPDLLWADEAPRLRLVDLPGRPTREVFAAVRRASATDAAVRAVLDASRRAFAEAAAAASVAAAAAADPGPRQ